MSTWTDSYAQGVRMSADKFYFATEAHHQLGDISRAEGDFCYIDDEFADDENYVGAWLTGFGFIEVKFPKATTRPATPAEIEWLATHPVGLA